MTKFKTDRSNVISSIIISEKLTEALDGIEDFSHLFVIFHMHKINLNQVFLKRHPRGRTDLPLVGTFATRAAHRPNPIGLALVELLEKKENILRVNEGKPPINQVNKELRY